MAIVKNGKGFRASAWNPATGKKIYSKTVTKRSEAKKLEIQLMKRIERGLQTATKLNMQGAYDLWLETVRKSVAERTLMAYRYNWEHYCEPLAHEIVERIVPADILRWRISMESKYAAETVNKCLSLVNMVLRFCRDVLRIIEVSPSEYIPRCKVKPVVHPTWDQSQIRDFLEFCQGSHYYAPLLLACSTGMRPGEICGLLQSDLKENNSIVLHRGMNNHGHVTEMKTERSHRTIQLMPQVAAAIRAYISDKRKVGCMRPEMFITTNLEPLRPDVLSNQFRAILGRFNASHAVQLPYIRLYDIRHSFATNNLMNGAKSKLVSEVMGNSVNTMEHHYAHLRETMHETLLQDYGKQIIQDLVLNRGAKRKKRAQ